MFTPLKLKKEVSETTADIDSDDILSVKKYLKGLGYYKEPEWGMNRIADRGMFSGIRDFQKNEGLKNDGIMKPGGETETTFNKLLRHGEYISTAAEQGLSLGWADEAEGVIGGSVYAIGDKLTGKSSLTDGFSRGYKKYRDERRDVLEEGYKKAPILTGASEAVGAIGNRVNFVKASATAPMKIIERKNLLDAVASGSVYGIGAGKGNVSGHATNALKGGALGYIGGKASAWVDRNFTKVVTSQGLRGSMNNTVSYSTESLINNSIEKKKRQEK